MNRSDLILLAYVILIVPAMLVGFFFARRKMFEPYHKFTMTTITIVNWILILVVMLPTYLSLPRDPSQPHFLVPTIHLIPGAIAQILATYLVIRMWFEKQLPNWFKVQNIKLFMRTTLTLWIITALLGVLNWAVLTRGFLSNPNVAPGAISTEQAAPSGTQSAAGTESANAINPKIVAALQPLVVTANDAPNNVAYLVGVQAQNALLTTQVSNITNALGQNDLKSAKTAAQAIVQALQGTPDNAWGLSQYLDHASSATKSLLDATADAAAIHAAGGDMQTNESSAIQDASSILQLAHAILNATNISNAQQAASTLPNAVNNLNNDVSQIISTAMSLNVPNSKLEVGA